GAVAIPLSTLATANELRDMIRHADVQHLIATPQFLHHDYVAKLLDAFPSLRDAALPIEIEEAPFLRTVWFTEPANASWAITLDALPASPDALVRSAECSVAAADAAVIVFSSGSTGTPKAVIHTHGTLTRQSGKLLDDWKHQPTDRIYSALPLFWVGGLSFVLVTSMRAGAAIVLTDDGSPRAVLDLLERERITVVLMWPHAARSVAADPTFGERDLVVHAGQLYEAWLGDGDPTLLSEALGMTESAGPHTAGQTKPLPEHLRGSFGTPMPGLEHRIVDPETGSEVAAGERGELLLRGDTMAVGLHRRERHTVFDRDGWYRTGDMCSLRHGHLFFHGRVDDQMKVSGVNVSPNEVERALLALPDVAQAFVVAIPDTERGSVVAAAVVPARDAEPDPHVIRDELRSSLASYKVPRTIALFSTEQVPLKGTGKLDRARLSEMLAALPRLS
ncbi:MAG: fatty acid--CoA ligase family protein, partial [Acidimicrobiia bacterium]